MRQIATILRRFPFTIVMVVAITLVSGLTGALSNTFDLAIQQRWGIGVPSLQTGHWETLITYPFFTRSSSMFMRIMLIVLLSIIIAEWRLGTRRTIVVYWITAVVAQLINARLALTLAQAGTQLGQVMVNTQDVGISTGGMGCIGAWVDNLPLRYRGWAIVASILYLILKPILRFEASSDMGHVIAFGLGYALAAVIAQRATSSASVQ
jgi:hypothetical protein